MTTPWRAILTSGPFWAIVVAHICYTWVMSWIIAYLPKYLKVVMLFDVKDVRSGLLLFLLWTVLVLISRLLPEQRHVNVRSCVCALLMMMTTTIIRTHLSFNPSEQNGLYSSLPFVGRMLAGFLSGWLSDWLLGRNMFSTATVRKIFQVVGKWCKQIDQNTCCRVLMMHTARRSQN